MTHAKMTDEQIQTMCEKLSWRFNSPDNRQDILQEGLLSCYEKIHATRDSNPHPAELYYAAKRSMHNYINLSTVPVSVPASRDVQEVLRENDDYSGGNSSQKNKAWLTNVIRAAPVEFDETVQASDLDQAKEFEDKEFAEYLYCLALSTLTREQWHVIKLRYYEGISQEDIAIGLKITQQAVASREALGLAKLKKLLPAESLS